MRRSFLIAISIVGLSLAALGQDEAQYKEWMKSLPPALGALRNASDNDPADATKIAETFDKVADFWKAKNASDAVQFAETARDAAKAISTGGDKASNLQKIQAQCGACHRAHRAGSSPDFTIK